MSTSIIVTVVSSCTCAKEGGGTNSEGTALEGSEARRVDCVGAAVAVAAVLRNVRRSVEACFGSGGLEGCAAIENGQYGPERGTGTFLGDVVGLGGKNDAWVFHNYRLGTDWLGPRGFRDRMGSCARLRR